MWKGVSYSEALCEGAGKEKKDRLCLPPSETEMKKFQHDEQIFGTRNPPK